LVKSRQAVRPSHSNLNFTNGGQLEELGRPKKGGKKKKGLWDLSSTMLQPMLESLSK